ncbi:hypothetical protein GO755_23320 [Spirosoma sp. HMF4905]|uniref:Uncharacterized protein n=1 Tax=Spirosoma arboris TaxID=2682092 RepID=A0A7K1SGS7_9BACT|nr:hypothetical protein [Spirosoma arboris]MVM32991.1 hypothetical protein [Spirosoma arboris]
MYCLAGFFPIDESNVWAIAGTMYSKLLERLANWMNGGKQGMVEQTVIELIYGE